MDMIIESTNKINDLESDLMPFLQKQGYSNFKIDTNFPWIKSATDQLSLMFDENSPQPNDLLENFKKYEYVMNVDKKELIDKLFKRGESKEEKAELEEIRAEAQHYEDAYMQIMTLAEDEVNFRLFRVVTKKLKNELAEQAHKTKEKILDATYNYCKETVQKCSKQFNELIQNIIHEPQTEEQYVKTKDWHAKAPERVEELNKVLKDVQHHLEMLEKFSYEYQDKDIEQFWWMKVFPLKVTVALQEGKATIAEKSELFQQTLQKDQEKFLKDIEVYKEQCQKIKTFNTLPQCHNQYQKAEELQNNLLEAFAKKKEFNTREEILS